MARTPLFSLVRRSLRQALQHNTATPQRRFDGERRDVLKAAAGAAFSLPFLGASACTPSATRLPVAIVGGGMAGLHAAYRLKARGLFATVFEASQRVGGRMYTDRATFAVPSLQHCELGGELIDTGHMTMRDLATELGLSLLDYDSDTAMLAKETVFFDGKLVSSADLLASFAPIADAILAANAMARSADSLPSYKDDNGLGAYDQLSIAAWLDQVGATGPARRLLDIAYTIEFGLETSEQSALNLLTLISTDTQQLALFGDSDERFHTAVGNDAYTSRLAAALEPEQVALQHKLVRVELQKDGLFKITLDRPGGTKDYLADRVVLAIPFTLLRDVELVGISLPMVKQQAIAELGYGTNTKLMVGFAQRTWRTLGSNGSSYTDLGYQNTWETSRLQSGNDGILTNYTGGARGLVVAEGTPTMQRDAFLLELDQVFPGAGGASTGAVARFAWPSYAYTRGSYSAYKVGQWTRFGGAEFERVGNLMFAGEHTSVDAQGYMEGAAITGAMVAEQIASDLGLAVVQALSIPAQRISMRARLALSHGSWRRAMVRRLYEKSAGDDRSIGYDG